MPLIETLIDAYIDANILILFAWMIWRLTSRVSEAAGLGQDFSNRLRMTEVVMLSVIFCPLLAPLVIQGQTMLFPAASLSATDFVLAQFLDGHLRMDALQFESILGLRGALVEELAAFATPLAWAVGAMAAGGLAVSLARLGLGLLKLRGILRRAFTWRRVGRLTISLSDEIRVPFSTRGLTRRHIVMPINMLADADQMRMAMAHELQHMRRNDVEIEIALALAQPLFFWNPAFLLWRRDLSELRELACDQALLRKGRVGSARYARCLLSVCRGAMAQTRVAPVVPFSPLGRPRNYRVLRRRIAALGRRSLGVAAGPLVFAPLSVLLVLCVLMAATTLQRSADWSQDRLMLSTIVNLERLEQRNAMLGRQ